jgi:hypothetical protein
MAFGAAPPGLAGLDVGGSSGAAAGKVRKAPLRPPTRQRLSYVPVHGYVTALVPLLAGSRERLPLPASFVGTMGRNAPTSFKIEDGSGGQPLYDVEVLHDEEGKSYLTGGWERFFGDYGLEWGGLSSRLTAPGRTSSASASSTDPAAPAPTPPGHDRRAAPKPPSQR